MLDLKMLGHSSEGKFIKINFCYLPETQEKLSLLIMERQSLKTIITKYHKYQSIITNKYGENLYKSLRGNDIDRVDWYVHAMNRDGWKQITNLKSMWSVNFPKTQGKSSELDQV